MLTAWMRNNESNKWSVVIKFVQLQKSSALNKGIGRTHYEALFGKCATVGLTSETKIPKEILLTLEKEEDLLRLQDDSLHSSNNFIDWGCLGFPWTMTSSGHISFNSDITKTVNSRPLSLCKRQRQND
jgi:hypothetical protein